MQQNYQTTKAPTTASTTGGGKFGGEPWNDPLLITVDDGNSAWWHATMAGHAAQISGEAFGFNLPPGAAIDGIQVNLDGSAFSAYIDIGLNIDGTTWKNPNTISGAYGGASDKWGAASITGSDLAGLVVTVGSSDISGGDGQAYLDYMSVTVYWHIELTGPPADVPTRVVYKTYSREGKFLGELPNVNTPFAFSQDINTAGSSLQLTCGKSIDQSVTTSDIETEAGLLLETEDSQVLQASISTIAIARGDSPDEALFKNSNRVKVIMFNYWYPNGKVMFSGQVNRVSYNYGSGATSVQLNILSDGLDLSNYIARGFPFTYTNDQSQTAQNGSVLADENINGGAGFRRYGQTFTTGAGVTNVAAISLLMQGNATVTIELYDAPGGNFLGGVTRTVASGSPTVEQFNFPQLIGVPASTSRFFAIYLGAGQKLTIWRTTANPYAGGTAHEAFFAGGGSGGSWLPITGDLYFVTKSGTPTTSVTFSSKDPVTNIASDVLADYNTRGGYIRKRNFKPTGLSLTYAFNMATVFDVIKKAIELSPTGFYSYVDLGTAEIDILQMSTGPDFTIVRGKDINNLDLSLSIEKVQNYLLLTGGETAPNVNLYRQYSDTQSIGYYGIRTGAKSDNRMTVVATANAVGNAFIAENSDETQETTVTVLNTQMDTTLLVPGKTIGFRNFGQFIDDMVLQIVRREFNVNSVTLTLGQLPVRMNDEVQRINRELQNEQTINNPAQPS